MGPGITLSINKLRSERRKAGARKCAFGRQYPGERGCEDSAALVRVVPCHTTRETGSRGRPEGVVTVSTKVLMFPSRRWLRANARLTRLAVVRPAVARR